MNPANTHVPLSGHYACSGRPRTLAEQNELAAAAGALFAKAGLALDEMQRGLAMAVMESRAVPAYEELAGLSRADEWTIDEWEMKR